MRRERIKQEAAAWVVRLAENADGPTKTGFEAWRAADVEHELAYEREFAAWLRLDRLSALRGPEAMPDPDLLAPLPHPVAANSPGRGLSRRWAVAAGVALMAGGGGGLWALLAPPAYATAIGERRRVTLADGSIIELNTDSAIVVHYARDVRAIEMRRGEALFLIAKDQRPFMVTTPGTKLIAQAGVLSVRLDDDQALVMVKSGVAVADTAAGNAPKVTELSPGSQALVSPAGVSVAKVSSDDIDRMLAWRQGAVAFNGQTLADAAAEFNRYNNRKIVIGDVATGMIPIGGYFRTSDIDGFVAAVERTFPVQATAPGDGSVMLSHRG